MKCKYCGSNLGFEDEVCPYCGRPNEQAVGQRELIREYRDEYEKTKSNVKVRSKKAARIGRLIVIAVLILIIVLMMISTAGNSNIEVRERRESERIAHEVDKNRDEISATLQKLEKERAYLKMEYYCLNYRLRSDDAYSDYSRVFTAAIDYRVIYDDILNIMGGFDQYGEKTDEDWCNDMAIYISDWNMYVEGEFWNDQPDSPMHAGEHGAFIADAKKEISDMVQVYFELTDDETTAMWDMEREELGALLYEKCQKLYPKEGTDE